MALVRIEKDEQYRHFIYRADDEPSWRKVPEPVEIPDELLEDYEEAVLTERRLRSYIIETYGKDDD